MLMVGARRLALVRMGAVPALLRAGTAPKVETLGYELL